MLPTERFLSYAKKNNLFEASDKILLTVSGGRDSVFMAHLFNDAKLHFGIAHCNFALRGNESDADEQFVENLAAQFSVPFFKVRFETTTFAETNGLSIQMAARQLRYEWFEKIKTENNYQYIAVAHHQSDATETVLLNLVRGTGISGLHGILPRRGDIVRPLLFLKRQEIDLLVQKTNMPFREDSSNASDKYARNKIRLKVIPVLKELNKDVDDTFAENSRRFAEVEEFLDTQVRALRTSLFTAISEDEFTIPLSAVKALYPRKLLLFEIFKPFGFQEPVLADLEGSWDGQPGKIFESHSHTILLDREQLFLRRKVANRITDRLILEEDNEITFERSVLKMTAVYAEELSISTDTKFAYFDASLLQFPLKLRLWNKGDYFYPFGMKGKKKLSDFFTGLKLPVFKKEEIPVLENGNGDIIWVVGLRPDGRYKVTPQSKKVLILEYINTHEQ